MLPTCEKLIETIVKNQLVNYVEQNDILSDFQSGYRKGYSCENALNMVIAKWKDMCDSTDVVICVFLDLKRAFETIDRKRLCEKLEKYGVMGVEKKWFENYLENRFQLTKIGDLESEKILNCLGVPQGSILGAFLFIFVYIVYK